MFSRVGLDGELAEQLHTLGGIGGEQVDRQPAGTHQHQPARALRVVEREPHRGAAAQRIAHQRSAFDLQVIEQVEQCGGAVAVVLLVFGVLVRMAVSRLVDGEDVEVLRQYGDVLGEVRPARCAGTAAVQQHDRLLVADAGFVIVQPHVLADLRIPGGRLERDLLLLSGFGGERRHQTIVSWGGSPNSLLPKIR